MLHIDLSGLRKQLVANGYHPLPNKDKQCFVKGWSAPEFIDREISRLEGWPDRWPDFMATGGRLDNGLGVIDNDADDKGLSDALWGIIRQYAPKVMDSAPMRFGGGEHKAALFVRIEGEDFGAIPHRIYTRPGQPDIRHKVEIFGSARTFKGNCPRQFGLYGPHSHNADGSVAREYQWADDRGLREVKLADLPALTKAQAEVIMKAFEEAAEDLGWIPVPAAQNDKGPVVYDIDDTTRFDTNRSGNGLSYEELCEQYAAHGDGLRCSSNFMPGRGLKGNTDRCLIGNANRHKAVAVFVPGDETLHFPKSAALSPGDPILNIRDDKDKEPDLPPDISVNDFYAYMPKHAYLFAPNGDLWPISSINSRLPSVPVVDANGVPVLDSRNKQKFLKPSTWLDKNRAVEQMSWAPGEPVVILNRLATEGGWIHRPGTATFNLYQPPAVTTGSGDAVPWLLLVRKLYPDHADHIVRFCAHRIQRPAEKINHALVLTGSPGIGKDTLLEPLKHGVGAWNFREVSPQNIMDKHNDFVRSVVLRISEARDLGDINRYTMYEAMKTLLASPPDMIRVDAKYIPQYYVPNITAVIATTNYPGDGMYLPADDRRHYVCGTEVTKDDFSEAYWRNIWAWYAGGGMADVVGYLRAYDLTLFDAKRPPEKTEAFWRMVDAGRAAEVPEMSDALDLAGKPDAVTVSMVVDHASYELKTWLREVRNRRAIPHRFESCGYVPVRNSGGKDGYWEVGGKRQVVYCKRELSPGERYRSAEKLVFDWRNRKAVDIGNVTPFKAK